MTKTNRRHLLVTAVFAVLCLLGCSKDHLDPTQIGRFRPAPAVNVILDSLGVAEETAAAYEGAEDPTPADVIAHEEDYSFSSGDVIRISIFELLREGYQYVDDFVVSESGNISIPEIGQIQAAGLTETQLEEEIRNALSPGVLKNPSVTVSLQNSMSRVFTILGDGVPTPGRYSIPRYDFRLMDALAVAGSARQFNVSYIYVARKITGKEEISDTIGIEAPTDLKTVGPGEQTGEQKEKEIDTVDKEMLEVIEPAFSAKTSKGFVIASAEMATDEQLENLAAPETVETVEKDEDIPVSNTIPQSQEQQGGIEWIFRDGKWMPVQTGMEKPAEAKPEIKEQPQSVQVQQAKPKSAKRKTKSQEKISGWDDIQSAGIQNRVIRIPKDKLYGGDPRYNVVIKPQDTITVQLDVIGEFYVLGNVNNQGVINLTGRPMTLKMAIASAGGLGQLAWPKKCEVIRRIGEKKEEIVMVDLEKIANGTQPDFFIKPNDVINVGTHGISRSLAVLRNAFRVSYGFGFIYDRNYSNRPLMLEHPGALLNNDNGI